MKALLLVAALCSATAVASDIGWHPKAKILSRDWIGQGKMEGMVLSGESCYTNTESQRMADLMRKNARSKKCPQCLHQYRYAESQVEQDGQRLKAADMCWTIVSGNGIDEVQLILATKDEKLLVYNFSMQYFSSSSFNRGELFPTMAPRR